MRTDQPDGRKGKYKPVKLAKVGRETERERKREKTDT